MILPRWYQRHKRALAPPHDVRARAYRLALAGTVRMPPEKIRRMVWQKYRVWPVVARPLNQKETILMSGIRISWSPPTARADGAPVDGTQFASVTVAQRRADGSLVDLPHVAGDQTAMLIANVAPGTHAFTVRYTDVQGQQGAASAEVAVTVPEPLPAVLGAPTGVVVEIAP